MNENDIDRGIVNNKILFKGKKSKANFFAKEFNFYFRFQAY
jgi:hypothetical protein